MVIVQLKSFCIFFSTAINVFIFILFQLRFGETMLQNETIFIKGSLTLLFKKKNCFHCFWFQQKFTRFFFSLSFLIQCFWQVNFFLSKIKHFSYLIYLFYLLLFVLICLAERFCISKLELMSLHFVNDWIINFLLCNKKLWNCCFNTNCLCVILATNYILCLKYVVFALNLNCW